MKTLTDQKIAERLKITFKTQQEAEEERQKFERAKALANTQHTLVDSERRAAVAEFDANAMIKTAEGTARAKTLNAEADATVLKLVGDATAVKITAVGEAEAAVLALMVAAVGADGYVRMKIAEAFAQGKVAITPHVLVTGGSEGGGNNLAQAILGLTASAKVSDVVPQPDTANDHPVMLSTAA